MLMMATNSFLKFMNFFVCSKAHVKSADLRDTESLVTSNTHFNIVEPYLKPQFSNMFYLQAGQRSLSRFPCNMTEALGAKQRLLVYILSLFRFVPLLAGKGYQGFLFLSMLRGSRMLLGDTVASYYFRLIIQ